MKSSPNAHFVRKSILCSWYKWLWISRENDNREKTICTQSRRKTTTATNMHTLKGAIEVCLLHFAYIIPNIIIFWMVVARCCCCLSTKNFIYEKQRILVQHHRDFKNKAQSTIQCRYWAIRVNNWRWFSFCQQIHCWRAVACEV